MFKNYKELQQWAFNSDAEITVIDINKIGCANPVPIIVSLQIGTLQFIINISYPELCEFMNEVHPRETQKDISDFDEESWYGYPTDEMLSELLHSELLEWFAGDIEIDLR